MACPLLRQPEADRPGNGSDDSRGQPLRAVIPNAKKEEPVGPRHSTCVTAIIFVYFLLKDKFIMKEFLKGLFQ